MANLFQRFRTRLRRASEFNEDLYTFALYEWETGQTHAETRAHAEQEPADEEHREKRYIRHRVRQLHNDLEKTARDARDLLDQDYIRWKTALQSRPGKEGTAWDDLMQHVRTHPDYQRHLHDTSHDTLYRGSIIAALFVVVAVIGFVFGPRYPMATVISIGVLVVLFWLVFGVLALWERDS